MAIGKSRSTEVERKFYTGVAAVKVVAFNPTKAELEKLYNRTLEKDPVYTDVVDIDGKQMKRASLAFYLQTVDPNGPKITVPVRFSIVGNTVVSKNGDKVQVIDRFGNTVYVPLTDPVQIPANIQKFDAKNFRKAYRGEDKLSAFLRAWLNIEEPFDYNADMATKWNLKKDIDLDACECCLEVEDLAAMTKGDFSKLKAFMDDCAENIFKVCFGVGFKQDGNNFQDVYTGWFGKRFTKSYKSLARDLESVQNNSIWSADNIHVWNAMESSAPAAETPAYTEEEMEEAMQDVFEGDDMPMDEE